MAEISFNKITAFAAPFGVKQMKRGRVDEELCVRIEVDINKV